MENSNENLTIQLHKYFSSNNFNKCIQLASPNVEVKAHAFGMTFKGQEEFRQFMQGFKDAFPDMVLHHENVISNGNRVAVEFTAKGTHSGPLLTPAGTFPPSGKKVELKVAEFYEWKKGLFTKMSNYQDAGSLMRQIGAL